MSWFDVAAAVAAFALVFPAELPDKTFVATLVMATRLRPLAVWVGVSAAFFVQCGIAVTVGGLLSMLPERVVAGLSAILFGVGAVILIRGGLEARAAAVAEERAEEEATAARLATTTEVGSARSAVTAFGVILVAEWGDLSQIMTAGLAARTGEPASVFVGAWVALVTVAGIGSLVGRWLVERVPLHRIRLVSGSILAVLAAVAAYEAVTG
ncbi:MAG: TMEM165/GDT1 family protein [Candidatus Nanopelagicales bacterium]